MTSKDNPTENERRIRDVIRDIHVSKDLVNKPDPTKKVYLNDILDGITIATVNTKRLVDEYTSKIRKEMDKNELLKHFSMPTFEIAELEADLKFLIREVEQEGDNKRIVIDTNPETLKLNTIDAAKISTLKLKIISKPFIEYTVGEEKVLREA